MVSRVLRPIRWPRTGRRSQAPPPLETGGALAGVADESAGCARLDDQRSLATTIAPWPPFIAVTSGASSEATVRPTVVFTHDW